MGNSDNNTSISSVAAVAVKAEPKSIRIIVDITHGIVLVLSLLLIVWISYDTFKQIPFLSNHNYMTFQFWVCIVFLLDFFFMLIISHDKKAYLKNRWFFFLISIPYLNIVNQYNITFSGNVLYYLRFVPLIRGAYSLSMVMGYISENRAVSLLWQYISILAALVYILAMLFYYQEFKINPDVHDFWDALYWAAMNMTTVGCYFAAVTPVGKIISVILPILGMMMLPLFTVYITDLVHKRNIMRDERLAHLADPKKDKGDEKKDDGTAASANNDGPATSA